MAFSILLWFRLSLTSGPLHISGPQGGARGITKSKKDADKRHHLEDGGSETETRIRTLSLVDKSVALRIIHLAQLKVARVSQGTHAPSLQDEEDDGADDGDEVEWEVEEVADDGLGRESGKRGF